MAHIPDGLLSAPVLIGGAVLGAAGTAMGLRVLDDRRIPQVAILSAGFFVLSLLAVPVGPSSVHLLLAALMGLMVGWAAFPAVLIGLLLQTVLFGFGGLTTLGVNTFNIAAPGVAVGLLLRPWLGRMGPGRAGLWAGIGAGLAVLATGGLVALALTLSSSAFIPSARILILTYLPLMLAEGAITGFAVAFLLRVRPESLLPAARLPAVGSTSSP